MELTIEHNGVIRAGVTPEEALAAGLPASVVNAAIYDQRLSDIKAECRRRIYAEASAETQMNMTAAVGVISGKDAAARTEDETLILNGAEAAVSWVAAMRAAVATLAADASVDFKADSAWPALPVEVPPLIDRF